MNMYKRLSFLFWNSGTARGDTFLGEIYEGHYILIMIECQALMY